MSLDQDATLHHGGNEVTEGGFAVGAALHENDPDVPPTRQAVTAVQRTIVQLIDDLDGSEATQTIDFSFNGKAYKLDLNDANAAEFEEVLAPYMAVAQSGAVHGGTRPTLGGRRPRAHNADGADRDYDPKEVRAWAQANNVEVSSRGRVSANVVEQFRAANA